MNTILLGATGATGKDLLDLLLKDDSINRIDVFVRRDINILNEKLHIHIIDFDKPDEWKHLVKGDVLFSCLGTTIKAAGSKEAQLKVDYTDQYGFAKAAKENNVPCYVLVSSDMASSKSHIFYTKMKGVLEDDVKTLKFPKLIIFKPPLLLRKNSDRISEIISYKIIKVLNKIGLLKSNKPLPTELLAKSMIKSVKTLGNGEHSIKGQNIVSYVWTNASKKNLMGLNPLKCKISPSAEADGNC